MTEVSENLLYDPATYRVTALLDYDFANILHPAHEFFQSFGTSGVQFLGWSRDKEAEVLRTSQLTGFLRHLHSPISGPGALSASTNSKYNTIALMLQQYCLPRKDSTSFHPIFSVAGKFVLVAASRDS
ncbi:hypothetical protein BofuT4_P071760.1 [Botrytis cinerea T4]|uniref:Aminoglycoside phosphotransferase domain-containing protein n=1 Tax=Botryotinia fuckeliana (strain T4) TaxID=999810 RepID=G2XPZ2_BOTF4|nr:hypothetical protein BofuT4_P071760.1 [Botrytis cinerea T4]